MHEASGSNGETNTKNRFTAVRWTGFWSCWADSNCRSRHYQNQKFDFICYPFVLKNTQKSLINQRLFQFLELSSIRPYCSVFSGLLEDLLEENIYIFLI